MATKKTNSTKRVSKSKSTKTKNIKSTYTGKFHNGKFKPFGTKVNWYWDIRLWSPLIIILVIIAMNANITNDVEPVPIQEPVIEALVETTETIPEPTISLQELDVIALARLADTVGRGRSEDVKRIIMWVAINRVEDRANGYGGTLQYEISRPRQWQQYDPEGMYLDTTYALAEEVYNTWNTQGARPIYSDMLWFTLNDDGSITVRNQFKEGKNRSEITFGQ